MEQKTRSTLRKQIMTILYQINVYEKNKIPFEIEQVIKEVEPIENEFVKDIVYGVTTYKKEIDILANQYLEGWTIDRLGNTDSAILRMGIYELNYTETPDIVCINEAVELAKVYSSDGAPSFVNGVLAKLV